MNESIDLRRNQESERARILQKSYQWLNELLLKYPNESQPGRSSFISTGSADERDAGIFSLMTVEEKGSEFVVDIDRTHYGAASDQAQGSTERYVLVETYDGGYVVQASGLVDSEEEKTLAAGNPTEEDFEESVRRDEMRRSTLHDASPEEIERFIDLVETAYLGEDYQRSSVASDEFDYRLENLLHDESAVTASEHDENQAAVRKTKRLGHYLLRILRLR